MGTYGLRPATSLAAIRGEKAIAYLRVSSVGQVGGDGFPRQREAIERFARTRQLNVVDEFRDEGVSGTLSLLERPGLSLLVERVSGNGVRLILVEKADRLARDLVEGELILREFRRLGIRVVEVEGGQGLTDGSDNPTGNLIRHVLGAVAEFEKSALVGKLRAARRRKREREGRCEGRKPFGDRWGEEETLKIMKRLHRRSPKTGNGLRLAAGAHTVCGVAWSGKGSISSVEVSVDNGATWQLAQVQEANSSYAWRQWEFVWEAAQPGHYLVRARAADTEGRIQPAKAEWNFRGFAGNSIHAVPVTIKG